MVFLFDPIPTLHYNDSSDIFNLCQTYLLNHSLLLIAIPLILYTTY